MLDWSTLYHLVSEPGDGEQRENRHRDGEVGAELAHGAELGAECPDPVPHEDEAGHAVKQRHADVRYRQVHEENVCVTPHTSFSWE